ncbi:hypothetical protein [Sediminicurvatus halobius]|uniref:Uncharacterized protein n=1 Tax=Sediminicurvatus halobius TaxID=2182432 RepID=A0A2U2MX62_9GAMM|nr:hypothetical protein [Spiribacter halobius]PWG61447.1 hypothetical protein DEM34_16240 [Spiribacter halobius]UEX77232.1 hypothetical protein LMH63_14960 [Spiribacter halobius]
MPDSVENLLLEHLRVIRSDLSAMKEDLREVKQRITSVESGVAGLRRDSAQVYADTVDQHGRYDRLLERIERIERRLEIQDEARGPGP